MAKKLDKCTVGIVGGGLTAGLIARQLTAKGIQTPYSCSIDSECGFRQWFRD